VEAIAPAAPTLRTIATLAAPAIAGQLLQTGVIYADRVMLGHAGGGALAAMQIAGPLEWTLASVTSAYAVGTLALVGRAVGARDPDAARRQTTLAMALALALGTAVAILARLVVVPALPWLFPNASQGALGALPLASEYLDAALFAAPFYCVGVAGMAAMSAAGDTVTPLLIGTVVNVVHVPLNWALIYGRLGAPALGVRGAGWSTVASYALEAALTLALLSRAGRLSTLRPLRAPRLDREGRADLSALAKLAGPAYVERLVYHASYMTFVWMIARLGDEAMAANQALIAIEALSFMTVEGFATAAGALVAQQLGAARPREALRVGWSATALAMATLSSFGVLFFALRHQLPALVTPHPEARAMATRALIVVALAQPFMAAGVVLGQAGRGAGATRPVMLVSVLCGFAVRLSTTWVCTAVLGLSVMGVWLGSTSDWLARTLLLALLWRSGKLLRDSRDVHAERAVAER
jgi:putative MATE family efflux protein